MNHTNRKTYLLSDDDLYLFNQGNHFRLYEKLGAHPLRVEGEEGSYFAVWAPDAEKVSVIGDFNGWNKTSHPLSIVGNSGIWEGFIPRTGKGTVNKYHVASRFTGYSADKTDPSSFANEAPPKSASVVWDLSYKWEDRSWMAERHRCNSLDAPISIYEVHLGSWMRNPDDGDRSFFYFEIAPRLAEYIKKMGFTHGEFLPVMEHPFYGSWGYQTTSYFAPTSRLGSPQDLMYLIEQ